LRPRRRQQMSSSCPGLSWGDAFGRRGLGMTHTPFSNCRFAKKAHMGQSKVNVPEPSSKKTVFFRPGMTYITESGTVP
jgi:hypothetical protein